MSRASVLARAQAAAFAGMVDTCSIRHRTGETTNPNTGVVTPAWSALYTGPCRVQQHQASAQQHDAGEDYVLLLDLEVQLPVSVTGLEVNDEITVTAAAHDADLVGRVFLIHDLAHKSEPSARRVQCTERTDS